MLRDKLKKNIARTTGPLVLNMFSRSINCASALQNDGFCWSEKKPMSVVCVTLVSLANLLPPW